MKAFPHKGKITINETVCGTGMMSAGQRTLETDEPGMDLRDYFAAKALQALIPITLKSIGDETITPDQVTKNAYEWADLLMKARGK